MPWILAAVALAIAYLGIRVAAALRSCHVRARTGSVQKLAALLARDPARRDERDRAGELPVHAAAKYGELGTLGLLLDRGSDVDARTTDGMTPLHMAAAFGELAAVRYLLGRGADPDPRDYTGTSALLDARLRGHEEVVALLLGAGADADPEPDVLEMDDGHFVSACDPSDAEMHDAAVRAHGALDTLRNLFRERRGNAQVKVPLTTDTGRVERVWGELLALDEVKAKVAVRTPPVSGGFAATADWPVAEILDWQVTLRDGTIRGGFGFEVLFHRLRARNGGLPSAMAAQERRFVDHARPVAS